MPKMKTRKAAAKRFKITKNGKIIHRHAGKSHLLTKKTSRNKRRKSKPGTVDNADQKRIRKMLPYG